MKVLNIKNKQINCTKCDIHIIVNRKKWAKAAMLIIVVASESVYKTREKNPMYQMWKPYFFIFWKSKETVGMTRLGVGQPFYHQALTGCNGPVCQSLDWQSKFCLNNVSRIYYLFVTLAFFVGSLIIFYKCYTCLSTYQKVHIYNASTRISKCVY